MISIVRNYINYFFNTWAKFRSGINNTTQIVVFFIVKKIYIFLYIVYYRLDKKK
ncbi:hypothetical protein (mitochondrion) [Glarea lozoyensis 74030]|uniref:Uncharacterized protein n=1 Tax=Glarea lozoyensis (strain ATCC 74030 / MF5533) TaxID=1104152 RepID=R9UST9_GLAL7|nr:hypothetical protein [Glarea lozoyensis 74030]